MAKVFVGSVRALAGKNMVCLGVAKKMLDDGYKLAFSKPYGGKPIKVDGEFTDADAWRMNQVLGLGQTPGQCCPVVRTQDLLAHALRGETPDLVSVVKKHTEQMLQGKDALLMSGEATLRSGAMYRIGGYKLARELDAKLILVDCYENEFFLDDVLSVHYRLGGNLAGVIINGVDLEMSEALDEQVIPFLAQAGVKTLGVIPKDDLLSSVSVADLAEALGAKPLTGLKYMEQLVKRFFIGAMQVGHARNFFGGERDFACIVGGDRPDMQLAAIEGGAACLILSGNFYPGDIIISRAEDHQVPILVVRDDTFSVSRTLDYVRQRGSLSGEKKERRAMELVKKSVDFEEFYQAVGLG